MKIKILFLFICSSLHLLGQISADPTWELNFNDEFTQSRSWRQSDWLSTPGLVWRAYPGYAITHGKNECQIYQYDNAVFDAANGVMKLVSEYDWNNDIPNQNYDLPASLNGEYPSMINSNYAYHPKTDSVFYFFSGEIDTRQKYGFGYYEIRCKLPLHNGSFPAFWLYGNGPNSYEEIDIFEYTNTNGDPNCTSSERYYRGYSSGIWYNPICTNYDYDSVNPACGRANKYAKCQCNIPNSNLDLSEYHTFGCEWLPDVIRWYRDGNVVKEYHHADSIPQNPKTIIINYALNHEAYNNVTHLPDGWSGSDVMTIDYVRYYKLKTDCNTDEYITTSSQLANFNNRMKHSITIGSSANSVQMTSGTNKCLHAEEISITGRFEVPSGATLTLVTHECPNY